MVSLIVFGVIALIVIVFLLSFNVKIMSKPEKTALPKNKPSEMSVINNPSVTEAEVLENKQLLNSTNESDKRVPQMSDEQYRRALRQFQASQREGLITTPKNRLNDTAYRSAIRSIKNQAKRD
ncbi:hypothetical protein [Desulfosporosinus sp. OT]|uniref:hypothetical protein n=1 Tax=Desulfosporosinus sp. OT TaxID=913865 RepID=UPI000223A05C|nr:hypothetical protein [Desulfosporosinus sp. OT]EGW37286.1 hypothetical protein DOT_4928 [Desulfosporosinus sp. OT]